MIVKHPDRESVIARRVLKVLPTMIKPNVFVKVDDIVAEIAKGLPHDDLKVIRKITQEAINQLADYMNVQNYSAPKTSRRSK
jgi:hypothetical protein